MNPPSSHDSPYASAGVDYGALDAGKRQALTAALATSSLLDARGGRPLDESRGEPAFVFKFGGETLAFVLEGLGTKSVIARAVHAQLGLNRFDAVAYDAVAAIVNDLCCVGALPLVVNAYFATGSSAWYEDHDRHAMLVTGWQRACRDAGATWGGGESPSLPELVAEDEVELAGSAVGAVPTGRAAILGADLVAGDEIVFVASNGLHANGSSLARLLARDELDKGYATSLPSGRRFGEALLDPTLIYAPLVERLLDADLPIHYLSHITGHGLLKLMRPPQQLTYDITDLPEVPEVLQLMVQAARMTDATAYSTFNMGVGYAIYCASGHGEEVLGIANEQGFQAILGGSVKAGPRRVILRQLDVVYETGDMDLAPTRAA